MPGPSTAQIARMRTRVNTYLPDTYTRERKTRVPDGAGGWTYTTDTTGTGACRLREGGVGASEAIIADKLDTVAPASIVLAFTADVTAADTLIINSRKFQIAAVASDGAYALCLIAVAKELPDDA